MCIPLPLSKAGPVTEKWEIDQSVVLISTVFRKCTVPSLVKIRSRGTSGQIGEMSLSRDFIYLFFSEARTEIRPFDRFSSIMAQNARNHARMCLSGLDNYFILTFDPCLTLKYQIQSPTWFVSRTPTCTGHRL